MGPWGQPDYGPPAPGGKGKLIGLIVGAVVVVVAVIAAGLVIFGGGSGGGTSSPRDAAQTFVDAVKDKDCDKIVSVTTDHFRNGEGADKCKKSLKDGDSGGAMKALEAATFEVKSSKTDGDDATVKVELKAMGQSVTSDMKLKKSDGKWKVDDFGFGSSGSDMPSPEPTLRSVDPSDDLPTY